MTTATFIGYLVAGTPRALVATLGMFTPSFLLVALIDHLLAAIRRRPWVRTTLDGVNVVAVALMAGVAAQLAPPPWSTPHHHPGHHHPGDPAPLATQPDLADRPGATTGLLHHWVT